MLKVAVELGLEPRSTGSKPVVLPLDDPIMWIIFLLLQLLLTLREVAVLIHTYFIDGNNLVLIFSKYEIAPGAVGIVSIKFDINEVTI